MTTIAQQLVNSIYQPASAIPNSALEVLLNNGSYTVITEADYYSATPPSTPLNSIVNVFSGSLTLSKSAFGMHHHYLPASANDGPLPATCGTLRTHDYILAANSGKSCRWMHIEPAAPVAGVHTYDWSIMDVIANYAKNQGLDLIFTVVGTPNWASARPAEAGAYGLGTAAEPADLSAGASNNLTALVTAAVTRYKGIIKYVEVWNEPNVVTNPFFTGTATVLAQMVKVVNQAAKAVDATVKIISPAVVGWYGSAPAASTYFTSMMAASDGAAGTMAQWVDIIGAHFYPTGYPNATAHTGIDMIRADILPNIRSAMTTAGVSGKPLWNTEFGILQPAGTANFKNLSVGVRAQCIRRCLVMAFLNTAAAGADRNIWYAYDDGNMGMTSDDLKVWNDTVAILLSGPITVVNRLKDGRLAVVVNGKNYLW